MKLINYINKTRAGTHGWVCLKATLANILHATHFTTKDVTNTKKKTRL